MKIKWKERKMVYPSLKEAVGRNERKMKQISKKQIVGAPQLVESDQISMSPNFRKSKNKRRK